MGGSSGGSDWFGGDGDGTSNGGFMGWLSSRFAQQDDVDAKIAALAARVSDQIEAIPTTNAQGQPDMMYLHDGVELNAQVNYSTFHSCIGPHLVFDTTRMLITSIVSRPNRFCDLSD